MTSLTKYTLITQTTQANLSSGILGSFFFRLKHPSLSISVIFSSGWKQVQEHRKRNQKKFNCIFARIVFKMFKIWEMKNSQRLVIERNTVWQQAQGPLLKLPSGICFISHISHLQWVQSVRFTDNNLFKTFLILSDKVPTDIWMISLILYTVAWLQGNSGKVSLKYLAGMKYLAGICEIHYSRQVSRVSWEVEVLGGESVDQSG